MSASSFRSVFMVASCAGAALGCYLVSLRVASERAALEQVETKIVLAQRDIRVLQTEIGTRGRLAQLERWNVKVIALSAPTADQFLKGGFELARLTTPQRQAPIDAPVILAAAPASSDTSDKAASSAEAAPSRAPAAMMHLASLKTSSARQGEVSLDPRKSVQSAPKTDRNGGTKASAPASRPKEGPAKILPAATDKTKAGAKDVIVAPRSKGSATSSSSAAANKRTKPTVRDPLAPIPETRTKVASAQPKTLRDPAKIR